MSNYTSIGTVPTTNTDSGSGLAGYLGSLFRSRVLLDIPSDSLYTGQTADKTYNTATDLYADKNFVSGDIGTIAYVSDTSFYFRLSRFVAAPAGGQASLVWDKLYNWADETFFNGLASDIATAMVSQQSDPLLLTFGADGNYAFSLPNNIVILQVFSGGLLSLETATPSTSTEYNLDNDTIIFGAPPTGTVAVYYQIT